MKKINQLFLFFIIASINVAVAQDYSKDLNDLFNDLIKKDELSVKDVNWEISSQHISTLTNVNHIYYYQTYNNIEIYNTISSLHIQNDGEILSSNNRFIKNSFAKVKQNSKSILSVIDAIRIISENSYYIIDQPLKIINHNDNGTILVSNGGISEYDIPAKLVYVKNEFDELVLCWNISILENGKSHWWSYFVKSDTGETVLQIDNVYNCSSESNSNENEFERKVYDKPVSNLINCNNCYEVIPMPYESPYFADRVVVSDPANYDLSPLGWHSDGQNYFVTKGNNINAFIGNEDNYEYYPDGGSNLNFSEYQFNPNFTNNNRFENAAITNLFYWGNILHDVLYKYGFDEKSGNFQYNNFNNGGTENDEVVILGQQDLNLCNAVIGVSKDGIKPFITLNVCGDKDGAFDNLVIIHEYVHGLSFRLTGGADSGNCLSYGEQMMEGWADWYALMLTMSSGDIGSNPRGIATYLFNQGENGIGVRDYPYSTDININPQTYDDIKLDQGAHHIGSVWGSILWELTWVLIEEYGFDENIYNFTGDIEFDAGNVMALAIVTEGMKFQPCEPGFIDARNAILVAFKSIYGGDNECLLWEAFAKRGLGYSAFQGGSNSIFDGTESFDMPPNQAYFSQIYENICENSNVLSGLIGGFPVGGVYSGPGVIDDGNGISFSFDPSVTGIGTYTVNYEILDGDCTIASTSESTIEVIEDIINPVIICNQDIIYIIPEEDEYFTIPELYYNILISDNCLSQQTEVYQYPSAGTTTGLGESVVEMKVVDSSGNESSCFFNLIVKKEGVETENGFEIYPNPTAGELVLYSKSNIELLNASIFDINGRLIQNFEFNEFGFAKSISIKDFTSGLYFIRIETKDLYKMIKILKE